MTKKGFAVGKIQKGEMEIKNLQDNTIIRRGKVTTIIEEETIMINESKEIVEVSSEVKEVIIENGEVTEIPEFIRRNNLRRMAPKRECERSESFMKKLFDMIGGKR